MPLHRARSGVLAERFARERDIVASLVHPHISRLYDAGVDAQGQPWLALELVQGQPIQRACDERDLEREGEGPKGAKGALLHGARPTLLAACWNR